MLKEELGKVRDGLEAVHATAWILQQGIWRIKRYISRSCKGTYYERDVFQGSISWPERKKVKEMALIVLILQQELENMSK